MIVDLGSIVRNPPSVEGNKRTGLAFALTLVDPNGIAIEDSSDILYDATRAVAEGRLERDDLAELMRRLCSSMG